MRILAIETAHPPGLLALAESAEIVAYQAIEPPRRTTEAFAELLQEMLRRAAWAADTIQLLTTTLGPGSFTGTRIGVTAAKMFAYAVGAPVVGVNTLELIASQSSREGEVDVVLDAQRNQLFTARFCRRPQLRQVAETRIVDADWLRSTSAGVFLAGPALHKFHDRLPAAVQLTPAAEWNPRADALAALAFQKFQAGDQQEPWQLIPNYYRKSAAEEKAAAKPPHAD